MLHVFYQNIPVTLAAEQIYPVYNSKSHKMQSVLVAYFIAIGVFVAHKWCF
jgi:hypothetical protein